MGTVDVSVCPEIILSWLHVFPFLKDGICDIGIGMLVWNRWSLCAVSDTLYVLES